MEWGECVVVDVGYDEGVVGECLDVVGVIDVNVGDGFGVEFFSGVVMMDFVIVYVEKFLCFGGELEGVFGGFDYVDDGV